VQVQADPQLAQHYLCQPGGPPHVSGSQLLQRALWRRLGQMQKSHLSHWNLHLGEETYLGHPGTPEHCRLGSTRQLRERLQAQHYLGDLEDHEHFLPLGKSSVKLEVTFEATKRVVRIVAMSLTLEVRQHQQ